MSFVIVGDTHATFDIDKVTDYFDEHKGEYTENDYLIICGDAGVCGFSPTVEPETRRILRDLPVTTLFIDGNHEHFEHLNSYPVKMWNGGKVHFVESKIIHLMRGQIFDIDGTKFYTFGGACSTDKEYRIEGIDWFPEELPSLEEYEEGWRNLEKVDFEVDYILSHTGPFNIIDSFKHGKTKDDEELRQYLQRVADNTEFKAWYFGHFHNDEVIEEKYYCLMDDVICLS